MGMKIIIKMMYEKMMSRSKLAVSGARPVRVEKKVVREVD